MHTRLENGLLADGLVLFGDNAYLNTNYMATPYPNIAGRDQDRSKDNYNFYHSQVSFSCNLCLAQTHYTYLFAFFNCFSSRYEFGFNVHLE